jgi:hypothetical protein
MRKEIGARHRDRTPTLRTFVRRLVLQIDVNYVRDAPAGVYENDVSSDHVVVIVTRRGRQFGQQIRRNRVATAAPIAVKGKANY